VPLMVMPISKDAPIQRDSLLSYFQEHFLTGEDFACVNRHALRRVPWSYRRIGDAATRWAAELASRDVSKGDRVLLWAGNSAEWVAAFYGCLLRGAVVVPLDFRSDSGFVVRVQRQVEARVLLAGAGLESTAPPLGIPILSLQDTPAKPGMPAVEWTASQPDDLVEIVFTSGTTAEPRGVCLSHRNLLSSLIPLEAEIQKYLKWERWFHPVRFLNLVPLSHIFGQFMGIFVPQLLKGEVHFQDSLNPGEVIDLLRRQRISVLVTVPRFLDSLKEKVEREVDQGLGRKLCAAEEDASFFERTWKARKLHGQFGWKFWAFVSAGATLGAATEAFWRNRGFAVVQGYGMTETAGLVSVAHPFRPRQRSIGKVMAGREMKIAATGEVLVRGDNVSPGIWNAGLQPLTDAEGWLHTGDLARPDETGHLYFQGRQKEVIVTAAGVNIYPEDLEAALNRQTEVRASAVVGVEGKQGPEPVAVLLLRGQSDNAATVVERANHQLASHQQMRRWLVWPEPDFPRTPTLKTRKPLLAAWVEQKLRESTEGRTVFPWKEQVPGLASLIAKVTGELPLKMDRSTRLDTGLKLDSLGRVELLGLLEQEYQVEIDEARISAATTLGDLEELLRARNLQALPDHSVSRRHSWVEEEALAAPGAGRGGRSYEDGFPEGAPTSGGVAPGSDFYALWQLAAPIRRTRVLLYHSLILPLTHLLCRIQVCCPESLHSLNEPALFVANHVTYADPGVILAALPLRFRNKLAIAMDGERIRGWRYPSEEVGPFRKAGLRTFYYLAALLFNVFPLPRQSGFRRSFAFAGHAMDRGYNVLIFPEGRLTENGEIAPFRNGIGVLATGLNAPVVPLKLDGLFALRQEHGRKWWRLFKRRGHVSVTFGQPIQLRSGETVEAVTRQLEQAVGQLGTPSGLA